MKMINSIELSDVLDVDVSLESSGDFLKFNSSTGKWDTIKNNLSASATPDADNDSTEGYSVGSLWFDLTASPHEIYRCVDATATAAVWVNSSLEVGELGALALLDEVALSNMASMATASLLGRNTAETGKPEVLAKATVLSLLNVEDGAEVNNISDTDATDLTDGGDTTLHDHDGISENTSARHSQNTDTGSNAATFAVTSLSTDGLKLDHNVETLAANKTLVATDMIIQKLDPDGTTRNITLPAENLSTDLVFFIYNMGGEEGENLDIYSDAPALLKEVHFGETAMVTCDGTTWSVTVLDCQEATTVDLRVKEENASAIAIGQPVYVSGATGVAFPTVGLADCDDSTKIRVKGLASEAIAQNTTGYAQYYGLLEGVNSTKGQPVNAGSEDWTAGDQLWVSATAGSLTNVRPTSGRCIKVGTALTVEGANSKIFVDIRENEVFSTAAATEDVVLRVGDDAGSNKVSIRNHSNTEVASVDSYGGLAASFQELVQASSDTLAASELRGQQITNFGQGEADNLQTLPTAAEGMSFVLLCGTAQAANYFGVQADTNDKIYLDGTAGSDNGIVKIEVPVVGAKIVFHTFQTGASAFDWIATTVYGTWIAA